ncbi:plasmid-related protein [Halomonas litopenaei]|uniref:plasmid-related protein n=1 Tax=Halomonas litopenaei TaxID=2109328 RepID=UPI001A8E0F3E|nr:plasmid-related protein [Halomonas litopenaei]MBN8411446.1 plasmid-related protein [Halomonas litopenaei]
MTVDDYLVGRFGLLMSISDLADLLGRSPDGVRVSLYSDTEVSRKLKPTMVKVGRRVYFRTLQVKEVLHLDHIEDAPIGYSG